MSKKSKRMCRGCRNDYYNGKGAEECWSYKDAKIVTRYRIGWWTRPTQPGAFTRVKVLNCYHESGSGQSVYYSPCDVPSCALTPSGKPLRVRP